mmetsp:Transcript_12726/g.46982  ORF Transcript_12726/g.46982 Transcript_12726/m.46982 type:complete len:914 (-) Transcript_12726:56-2797(-)
MSETERLRRDNERLRQQLQQTTDQLWDLQCNAATTEAEVRASAKADVEKLRSEMLFQSSEMERMRRDGQRYKRELEGLKKTQAPRSQEFPSGSPKRIKSESAGRVPKKTSSPRQHKDKAEGTGKAAAAGKSETCVGDAGVNRGCLEDLVQESFGDFAFLATLDAEIADDVGDTDPSDHGNRTRMEAQSGRDRRLRRATEEKSPLDLPRSVKELSEQVLSGTLEDMQVSTSLGLSEAERRCLRLLHPYEVLARTPVQQLWSGRADGKASITATSKSKTEKPKRSLLAAPLHSPEDSFAKPDDRRRSQLEGSARQEEAEGEAREKDNEQEEELQALSRAIRALRTDELPPTAREPNELNSGSVNGQISPRESAARLQRRCAALLMRSLQGVKKTDKAGASLPADSLGIFQALCVNLRCFQLLGLAHGLLREDLCLLAVTKVLNLLCHHLTSSTACLFQTALACDRMRAAQEPRHPDLKPRSALAAKSAKSKTRSAMGGEDEGIPSTVLRPANAKLNMEKLVPVKRVPGDNDTESTSTMDVNGAATDDLQMDTSEDFQYALVDELENSSSAQGFGYDDATGDALSAGFHLRVKGLAIGAGPGATDARDIQSISRMVLGASFPLCDGREASKGTKGAEGPAEGKTDAGAVAALESFVVASRHGLSFDGTWELFLHALDAFFAPMIELPRKLRIALLSRFQRLLVGPSAPFPGCLCERRWPVRRLTVAVQVFRQLTRVRGSGLLSAMLRSWGPHVLQQVSMALLQRCVQSRQQLDSVLIGQLLAESLGLLSGLLDEYGDPLCKLMGHHQSQQLLQTLVRHLYRETLLLDELKKRREEQEQGSEELEFPFTGHGAALLVPEREHRVRERVLLAKRVFDRLLIHSSEDLQSLVRRIPIKYQLESALHKVKLDEAQVASIA